MRQAEFAALAAEQDLQIRTAAAYLSVLAGSDEGRKSAYLMVVNRSLDRAMTATIGLKGFVPSGPIRSWTLNGPSVDATNEVNHDNVKVTHRTHEVKGAPFEFTFEPHSLTAIEIDRKSGE